MDEIEACLMSLSIENDREAFGTTDLIEMDRLYATNEAFIKVQEDLYDVTQAQTINEKEEVPLTTQSDIHVEYENELANIRNMKATFYKELDKAQQRADALHREIVKISEERQQALSTEDEKAILAILANDFTEQQQEEGHRLVKLLAPSVIPEKKNNNQVRVSPLDTKKTIPLPDWHYVEKEETVPDKCDISSHPLPEKKKAEEKIPTGVKPMSPLAVKEMMDPMLDFFGVGEERGLLVEMMEMIVSVGLYVEILTFNVYGSNRSIVMDVFINHESKVDTIAEDRIVAYFNATHQRRVQLYQSRDDVEKTCCIHVTLFK